jgi:hypothetical protein
MNAFTFRQGFLLLLGLAYIVLGIYIFLKKIVASPWSEILALLFVIYGTWRSYRALMK